MKPYRRARLFASLALVIIASLAGCAENSGNQSNASRRADEAIRDPWGYQTSPPTDITGGDTGHLDRDAMQRDVDHFLNP
jgi:hypothetical protein